jgi:N6-adenosine-specific RNA methylase IME4
MQTPPVERARQRRPGWTAWGDELDKFEPEYERVAAGGPKWVPK